MQCEVWSVECEDFALSLAEKIKRLSREGHGRDRWSLNYRSFMFGKLPPPACPGLCYQQVNQQGAKYANKEQQGSTGRSTSRSTSGPTGKPKNSRYQQGVKMISKYIFNK